MRARTRRHTPPHANTPPAPAGVWLARRQAAPRRGRRGGGRRPPGRRWRCSCEAGRAGAHRRGAGAQGARLAPLGLVGAMVDRCGKGCSVCGQARGVGKSGRWGKGQGKYNGHSAVTKPPPVLPTAHRRRRATRSRCRWPASCGPGLVASRWPRWPRWPRGARRWSEVEGQERCVFFFCGWGMGLCWIPKAVCLGGRG